MHSRDFASIALRRDVIVRTPPSRSCFDTLSPGRHALTADLRHSSELTRPPAVQLLLALDVGEHRRSRHHSPSRDGRRLITGKAFNTLNSNHATTKHSHGFKIAHTNELVQ